VVRLFYAWFATVAFFSAQAAPIQNSATGTHNGVTLNLANAVVNLNRLDTTNAVTGIVAEITPNVVAAAGAATAFDYDILPTIGVSDTGINQVTISAPTGYTGLAVTGVSAGGVALSSACATPGTGQYCAVTTGQVITITFGTKISATLTNIHVSFTANTLAAAVGSADVISAVDDTSTTMLPQQSVAGNADGDATDANSLAVAIVPPADPITSTVTVDPQIVIADGSASSTITVTLRDANNQPAPAKSVTLSSSRAGADTMIQPPAVTDAGGVTQGAIRSTVVGVATITATDVSDSLSLAMQPPVYFSQGQVLEITKRANKKEAVVGDVVTYTVEIKNKTTKDVVKVRLLDLIPPNFKYLKGSARMNGAALADPSGNRPLILAIGTVPARADANGNGQADPGEPGYLVLGYQLVVGSGATPKAYVNTAVAVDVCDQCGISREASAQVTVVLDPVFDLGTIIGKVFEDKNKNGWQDEGEAGVPAAMVALDDGTYALTDKHGRYHFAGVSPGQRLVKINLQGFASGATTSTDEARVVAVTPGLLAKANFGVAYEHDVERIGRPSEMGMAFAADKNDKPIQVTGNVPAWMVLINGKLATLSSSDVRLQMEGVEDVIEIKGYPDEIKAQPDGQEDKPIKFWLDIDRPEEMTAWKLMIMDSQGAVIRTLHGEGLPEEAVQWDGKTEQQELVKGGEIYQYQMEISYTDGSRATSARRVFGVDRTSAIALRLTGGAFESGSEQLSTQARQVLQGAAEVMRQFPQEKIIIEGHADALGSAKTNLELSRKRAQAAADYLVNEEKIPMERLVVRWFGSQRPVASNLIPEGRELNRRVDVGGEVQVVTRSRLLDHYRVKPELQINGADISVDPQGRFSTSIETPPDADALAITLSNAQGRSVHHTIPVPRVEILEPKGEIRLSIGSSGPGYRVHHMPVMGWGTKDVALVYRLVGRTAPDNTVEMDGKPLVVAADGTFSAEMKLKMGNNIYGLLVRNPQGYLRLANVQVKVSDRDAQGQLIVMVEKIPNLTVNLPTQRGNKSSKLTSPVLAVSGATDPGNQVRVNGQLVALQPGGDFLATLTLPKGKSQVVVQVVDEEGHSGVIEREVEVTDTRLFFLAFADGTLGQLQGKGYLQGAGMEKASEFYSEGRVAYYLKGYVAGKYLVTSAFDSGIKNADPLFKDIGRADNDRLFTNLDPDKLYPVYGDGSTLVYDAQSEGRFYLAVDSQEMHLLVGNYPLSFTDTELAAYQRTLYGGRYMYQSLARTPYGQPETAVVLFGAEVLRASAHDEVRASGGSFYYLSRAAITEGSEQVSLVVRDKNTGLVLSRQPQVRNQDYTIQYTEGRILFNRPLASVAGDGLLINPTPLGGNPVYVYVDYEYQVDALAKMAAGARVRKQLGDHLAVGGTYVQDELAAGQYQLQGLDGELRWGKGTRLLAEIASSRGSGPTASTSDDGGLTYTQAASMTGLQPGSQEGEAWKLAVNTDAGEWFGRPERFQLGGYINHTATGFRANGNLLDQGRDRFGLNAKLKLSGRDDVLVRYDNEDLMPPAPLIPNITPGAVDQSRLTQLQWRHNRGRWGLAAEYQARETLNAVGDTLEDTARGALRLNSRITTKLDARLTHQLTLAGIENTQTTLGLDYQWLPKLALQVSGTQSTLGQAAQLGVSYLSDKNRIYLAERLTHDQAGQARATVVGGETPFGPAGKVYSEYQWETSDTGDRNLSLVGAQRQWNVGDGLQFRLSGEHATIDVQPLATKRTALATGLSYSHPMGITASTRDEMRWEEGGKPRQQFLTINHIELKINPDYSVLGKYRYGITRDLALNQTEAKFAEQSIGLAYRPVAHDWLNGLARYTHLAEQRPLLQGQLEGEETAKDIASIEWSLDINPALEWVGKQAFKIKREQWVDYPAVKTHTYLSIQRLNYHLRPKLDLGMEYRILSNREADDQRQGWLSELSWKAMRHLRLGVGYNFTDFSDNEFSDNNYSTYGWFMRVQGMY